MVEALKKLDRKFLITFGVLILLPIVLIIFLAIIQGCSNGKMSYEKYQDKMISSLKSYLKNDVPTEEGEFVVVNLNTLVEKGYIKDSKKALNDDCSGFVTVRRNGSSIESNNGGFLNYTVTLNCNNYNTLHLSDKLKEKVVTSESGLYKVGDEYIFKGDNADNYIQFFGKNYRIVSMDKDGIIKLVDSNEQEQYSIWDNKYNSEIDKNYGKTIFKDSTILKTLLSIYDNKQKISKDSKAHIVAYDVCTGKRSKNDLTVSREVDCSTRLEKQVISLLNVSDFALASTDSECNSLESKSCRNYNYLYRVAPYTWTMNSISEDSYNVFYYVGGTAYYQKASTNNVFSYVIYIDGNELYQSGEGTKNNPYILK